MRIAVVTGASSGIGRQFAIVLDREGTFDEIWLIARREEALRETARMLSARCRVLSMDLTRREAIEEYTALLADADADVGALVNASGYGKFCAFEELPMSVHADMIALNITALVAMTRATLPYMKNGGRIFQMGSLSAFQPVPYLDVYAATKAFVLRFSRALNVELRARGVRVLCVCPGWVKTAFFDRADTGNRSVTYFNRLTTPEKVVARAFLDMRRGKDVSVEGFSLRVQTLLVKILPHTWVMRVWMRQQKHG